jgi:O-antigen ligase
MFRKVTADHLFFGIYFGFLTIGLFLGDGKQPMIDTLASVVIISLHILAKAYLKKQRTMPQPLVLLWSITLGYFAIRTMFSESVAYSITATMRMVMAYLVFTLFFEYNTQRYQRYFRHGLIIFSLLAIAASLLLYFSPSLANNLPLMNLLYPNYGHNHLVNILVVVYPITLFLFVRQKNIAYTVYYLLVAGMIFLSFSRGALFLIGLYTIFQVGILQKTHINKRALFLLIVGIIATVSLIYFSFLATRPNQNPSKFSRQLYKPLFANESRWEYWNQAWEGIKQKPLFGSGPGTFYLISKRYQSGPNQYSWFAHNSMLQWVVELGIVGSIPLLFTIGLLLAHTQGWAKHATILVMLNSFFDFNLDFLLIWLVLWTILGLYSSYESKRVSCHSNNQKS